MSGRFVYRVITFLLVSQMCSSFPRVNYSPGKRAMPTTSATLARIIWSKKFDREPTCDELRALWRFSVRKSQATELTNEIPTYRDPFAYSKISTRYQPRNIGVDSNSRELWSYVKPNHHIYGTVVHSVAQDNISYGSEGKSTDSDPHMDHLDLGYDEIVAHANRNKAEVYRLADGSISIKKIPALKNSFNTLKEAIRRQRKKQAKADELSERERTRYRGQSHLRSPSPYSESFRYVNKSNGDKSSHQSPLIRQLTDGLSAYHIRPVYLKELPFLAYSHLLGDMYDNRLFMNPMQVISNIIPIGII
ncbi:uncharacterized protein [Anabrus simplex]|uniref:uncharacterized protein n=1 Tax=Anabrus simplex TaxID=316456 RepID=UPI0035A27553